MSEDKTEAVVVEVEKAPVEKTPVEKACEQLGISRAQVDAWKEAFGKVGLVYVGGKPFFYRPIRRIELREVRNVQAADPDEFENIVQEKITVKCALAPRFDETGLRMGSAGIATTISSMVYQLSDYGADAEPIVL